MDQHKSGKGSVGVLSLSWIPTHLVFSFRFDLGESRRFVLKVTLESSSQNILDKRFFAHIFSWSEIPVKVHMILFV